MKPLLTCLLVGCLVSPVCAQERNLTLEEFVQMLEDGQPWTPEKTEAQLGIKRTKNGAIEWHKDPESYGEGFIVNAISYTILEVNELKRNEVKRIRINFDDKSDCFTQERIKNSYKDGDYIESISDAKLDAYYGMERSWGWVIFGFKGECVSEILITVNAVK
jgi:hypothetical protein